MQTLQRCSDNVTSGRRQHVAVGCVVILWQSHLALLLAERDPDGCYLLTIKTIVRFLKPQASWSQRECEMYSTAYQHVSMRFTTMPTPYFKRQTPVTQRMAEDMLVRNLAPRTIDSYTYHVDRFARHFNSG